MYQHLYVIIHDRSEKVNCSLSLRRFKSDQILVHTLNLNESDVITINNKLFLKTYVHMIANQPADWCYVHGMCACVEMNIYRLVGI